MPLEHGDGHILDSVFIVEDLAFVLDQEVEGYLAQGGRAPGIDEGLDQERLIDMAHLHPLLNEVGKLLESHFHPLPIKDRIALGIMDSPL